jgi:hypothetical protein
MYESKRRGKGITVVADQPVPAHRQHSRV